MSIRYNQKSQTFIICTQKTQYVFKVVAGKYLVHCYYGSKSDSLDYSYNVQALSFSPAIKEAEIPRFSLNDAPLEFSYFNSGDYRCCSLRIRGKNGDSSTLFEYNGYEIIDGRVNIEDFPNARACKDTETLVISLLDKVTDCELKLYYTVYPEYDIISRYFALTNKGNMDIKVEKAMSICLDLPDHCYDALTLHGCQTTEMNIQRSSLRYGNFSITSRRGASSHDFNPFMAIVSKDATEEYGDVYALNFVYSGSFLNEIEVNAQGNTRISMGLGEETFAYTLTSGECFRSPEAVMTYTADGIGDMSRKMHCFIRNTIMPRECFKHRPIVLNTWEACYYKINEDILLSLSSIARKCGMDMIVLDDGWFGKRDDDTSSLGDWILDKRKFPNGLKYLSDKIHAENMKFGIWIEPEMINYNSQLYKNHPEWCLVCKGRQPTLSRDQLLLDLCNPDVLEYLKDIFKKTFAGIEIDYFKWDFNRNASEYGSTFLGCEQQDEALFRYQKGAYELLFWFKKQFPNTFIETCSGGGGRYDLGMMAFSSQIWASDNTTAKDRLRIQYGCTLAYPAAVMSCHVSDPRNVSDVLNALDYKYKVAIGGMLGYELNLIECSEEIKNEISGQIKFYRNIEDLIKTGYLFRLISPFENSTETAAYYYSDKECNADKICLFHMQNFPYYKRDISWHMDLIPQKVNMLKIKSADPSAVYFERLSGQSYRGADLISGIPIRASESGECGRIYLFERKEIRNNG